MSLGGWYRMRVSALCVLLGVAALTLALLPKVEWGQFQSGGKPTWDVVIEHFGIDSDEIERSITVPLEAEMARLPGVTALRSVSEFGKSRVTAELSEDAEATDFFLALSDAVDRIEPDLPPSVQKPRIVSSGSQSPAFIASLQGSGPLGDFRDWVERVVKPSVEKRPGVGEVEVGGGELQEVHVVVDEARAAAWGLSFDDVARALQTQDVLLPAGTVKTSLDRALSIRGRLEFDEIAGVRIPLKTGSLPLGSVARVEYAGREPDTTSRLDGQERVVLLVHATGAANLIAFSRQMNGVLAELNAQDIGSKVILDEGKVLEDALWETLRALAEGLGAVLLLLPLLLPPKRIAAVAVVLPLSLAGTVSALGLSGVSVDRFALAGFAVGLSTVLDFALLVSLTDDRRLGGLLPSLGTALVTTLLFLAPLAFLDFVWPGIRTLVLAVGLLLIMAFVLTALFVPVIRGRSDVPLFPRFCEHVARSAGRCARRFVQATLSFSIRRAGWVAGTSVAAALAAGAAVAIAGVDLGTVADTPELSAHIEYESEASLASADDRTKRLVESIQALGGVTGVQSLARPGSAELTVSYRKGADRQALIAAVVAAGREVPGCFVYLPQPTGRTVSARVTLSGDDNAVLRSLAKQAAQALSEAGFDQAVLNFKDPPKRLAVIFDPVKMDRAGLTAADAATSLRWNLWGPVALKWVSDRERDLRVMGARGTTLTRTSLMELPIVSSRGDVRLAAIAQLVEEKGGAKIYHENRQRAVYLTVQTSVGSAKAIVQAIDGALRPLIWPSGYSFQVDPRLADEEEHFSLVGAALGLSLVLIGLLLGARTQSLGSPLLTLTLVPVAMAFPVGAAAVGGFTVPVILALVLSGGTVVNNAILIVDSARTGSSGARAAVRRRLPALTMTNLTALLGALPLALAGQGGLLSTLAGVVSATALGAAVTTLTTVPALLTLFPRPRPQS